MSNFGVNPAPIIGTSTGTFPRPVLPTPAPSSGLSSTVQNPATSPVLNAAAGPKCNIVWVNSMDEVLAYPTSPSEEMYFHDKNEPVIYRRETDANGNVKNPVHALRYTVEEVPFGPEAQFVTKDEHKQLYDLVAKLSNTVDGMNGKLEQLLNG